MKVNKFLGKKPTRLFFFYVSVRALLIVNNRIQTILANVLSHRIEINRVSLWRTTFSFPEHFSDHVELIFFPKKF